MHHHVLSLELKVPQSTLVASLALSPRCCGNWDLRKAPVMVEDITRDIHLKGDWDPDPSCLILFSAAVRRTGLIHHMLLP